MPKGKGRKKKGGKTTAAKSYEHLPAKSLEQQPAPKTILQEHILTLANNVPYSIRFMRQDLIKHTIIAELTDEVKASLPAMLHNMSTNTLSFH